MSRFVGHETRFIFGYAFCFMLSLGIAGCDGGGAGDSPQPTPTPDVTAMPTATASSVPTASPSPAPAVTATPVPTPTPDVSARACLNPDAYQDGAYIETSTRVLGENGDVESVKDVQIVIDADAEFRGEPAIEADTIETSGSVYTIRRYAELSVPDDAIFELGHVRSAGYETAYYAPPVVRRFDLQVGDSYEQTYWQRWVWNGTVPILPPGMTDHEETLTITYVGREKVTVPAGTFETCRFEELRVTPYGGETSIKWIAVGSGALVRSVMQATPPGTYRRDQELVSFSITLP
ncbi:hypothetical protein [Sinimarinibacterium sp. NLF-5-8]|uniref:hypothetical protein n=1 Tax=Sinimarinibacterium sp. NLF-5-8 TaxID=2698684 RepID=UPI00137BC419|nr:hypothetical protein [Sinimarinibacterium sp. NLF-5-8]QHS09948.1 hypothetical protein GT972_07205 [Sinimarinibacterium sp. NLF-5-8]